MSNARKDVLSCFQNYQDIGREVMETRKTHPGMTFENFSGMIRKAYPSVTNTQVAGILMAVARGLAKVTNAPLTLRDVTGAECSISTLRNFVVVKVQVRTYFGDTKVVYLT